MDERHCELSIVNMEVFHYILQFIVRSKDVNSLMRTCKRIRQMVLQNQEVLLGSIYFPFAKNFSRLRHTGLIILKEKEDITDLLLENRGDLQFVIAKENILETFDRDLSSVYLRHKISIQINGNIVIIHHKRDYRRNTDILTIAIHGKIISNSNYINSFLTMIIKWIPSELPFSLEWTTCDDSHNYYALKTTLEWMKSSNFYRRSNFRSFRLPFNKLIPRDIVRSIGKCGDHEIAMENINRNTELHETYVSFVRGELTNMDMLITPILADGVIMEFISTDDYHDSTNMDVLLSWIVTRLVPRIDSLKGKCIIITMNNNCFLNTCRENHVSDQYVTFITNLNNIDNRKFNVLLNVY